MKTWVVFALLSMVFAGFTSVIAKMGLQGISGDLGLAVRTVVVFALVMAFAAVVVPMSDVATLTRTNILWLALSGLTTTLSWVFYYKALQAGDVSTVALIDKGSVVVALVLAAVILKEHIPPRTILGAALMVAGLLLIARK